MLKAAEITKIKEYKQEGLTVNQVVDCLGYSYKTVKKYWDYEIKKGEKVRAARKSKYKEHKKFILKMLKKYPGYNAIQIYQRLQKELKKKGQEIDIAESTMRRFVKRVREEESIPKIRKTQPRDYVAVVDPDPGKQAQFDFGEYNVLIDGKRKKKVYFAMLILSYSRYRVVEFRDKPFNTDDVIEILDNSLEYLGGCPEEIVIDQDTKMVSNEEGGVFSLTEKFSAYVEKQPFRIRLMHKRDPESKGKVERSNYYLEQNFLNGYFYTTLEKLNQDVREWMEEIANVKENATTKEPPVKRFKLEKPKLLSRGPKINYRIISQQIAKDNTVSYNGNRYDVPKGSYVESLKKKANLYIYEDRIEIYSETDGRFLSSFPLEDGVKGKLYTLDGRKENSDTRVQALKQRIFDKIDDYPLKEALLEKILETNPDFRIDQLMLLEEMVDEWIVRKPLLYQIFNDFKDYRRINVQMMQKELADVVDRLGFDVKEKPNLSKKELAEKLYHLSIYSETGAVCDYSKDYIRYLENEFA